MSFKSGDYQMVGVRDTLHWSKDWRTFPDFLTTYVKQKLGEEWGNAEQAKPLSERHPFMQIFEAHGRQLNSAPKTEGGLVESAMTGAATCFLGVAYGIYLLEHNVELQERLLKRLRNRGNFQGAYYELWIAGALIRAGFELELSDERGGGPRHCEWDAISRATGQRFTVEVKMRGVEGVLGRTAADGGPDNDPKFANLLLNALKKPATGARLIFIDVNVPYALNDRGEPDWLAPVMTGLETFEREKLDGRSAYTFITNISFHRELNEQPHSAVAPFGLGIPDFAKVGPIRISEAYRQKKKHSDAFHIFEAMRKLRHFPITFDGSLPSETFGGAPSRLMVGQTYFFPGGGDGGSDVVGKVRDVTVLVLEKKAYYSVTDVQTGKNFISLAPMTDAELADYAQFGDSYFGKEDHGPHVVKDEFELFEWLMTVNATVPRARLLEWLGPTHEPVAPGLGDEDLLIYYCEAMVAAHVRDRGLRTGGQLQDAKG